MKVNRTKFCLVATVIAICTSLASESSAQLLPNYPDGRRTAEFFTRSDGRKGSARFRWDADDRYASRPQKTYGFSSPYVAMNAAFRVINENYDYNNEGGGPSHYTYDDQGKLVQKVFDRADGLKTTTSYEYDGKGNLKSSHREYLRGLTADFEYEFDAAPRLTKRTCRRSDGESGYEQYVYDRLGRLQRALYDNMDFWLNGEIHFQYDGWGHIAGGRFDSRDGNDAVITFETDADGNVLKMHWEFGSAKTQTYFFEYEALENEI